MSKCGRGADANANAQKIEMLKAFGAMIGLPGLPGHRLIDDAHEHREESPHVSEALKKLVG